MKIFVKKLIYCIEMENKRIVAFQIPPAIPGIVTTWHGASYAREDESLVPLPMNKIDLIRSQVGRDWSKEIVSEATIDDLDPEAVAYARKMFIRREENRDSNYTQLLHANGDLDLRTVFLLDQVQKKKTISKEDFSQLKSRNLVEGRYPNIFVSYTVAKAVGNKATYVRQKGLDEEV